MLARGLSTSAVRRASQALEALYADADIARYAVWVHDSETAALAAMEGRGYHVDTSTRAMAMSLDEITMARPDLDLAPSTWHQYLQVLAAEGLPEGLMGGVEPGAYEVRIARVDGEQAAAALALHHEGDCGIYNVGTLPHARRRGLGTALTVLQLHDARERGCTTASLQATEMAEGMYARIGFRDLGRFIEYVK